MFKKVLLSEDIDTISQGVMSVMDALHIHHVEQAQYCDDAYLKIKKANLNEVPYDLLITDLSFKEDHRIQQLKSGDDLIKVIRNDYPDIKVIVYSIEDRAERVRHLLNDLKINGYVSKGRKGLRELEESIVAVNQGNKYVSPELDYRLKRKAPVEISSYDIEILQQLSLGNSQEEICNYLESKNIKPRSLSSLEKRLNVLREHFKAKNAIHLVTIAKDLGLI
ncbi:response regulator [Aequorivita viscosa]|uniref:DNA-binding response regulator, NarL/FixJ family, contains REC and HTH domains n=1 Tax=Aequorivita viscosa TaxID=797419 RepID=A0A1M6NFX8_9FLAO|nr:response regulator [Aequorivita viscosa]SDX35080.1 DNA-binding response regulator, NarL/FixJ family, contains REC and HTH domains [Aequorivita viscosa]SHJ94668.1 DNA-binding response regulator, NarL/FixJ family, contains REC and HTH domains [Aequorivita viscosa]